MRGEKNHKVIRANKHDLGTKVFKKDPGKIYTIKIAGSLIFFSKSNKIHEKNQSMIFQLKVLQSIETYTQKKLRFE